jgi:putative FmdB family regulatory protein
MPIYAYRCTACGREEDVLQKITEDPLTICPACNQPSYSKQVTAAGFQLKGSGWYVTDFRDRKSAAKSGPATETAGDAGSGAANTGSAPQSKPAGTAGSSAPAATPGSPAPAA